MLHMCTVQTVGLVEFLLQNQISLSGMMGIIQCVIG